MIHIKEALYIKYTHSFIIFLSEHNHSVLPNDKKHNNFDLVTINKDSHFKKDSFDVQF